MKLKKGKFLGAIVLSLFLLASCKSLKNTNTLFQSDYDKFADTAKTIYVANAHEELQFNDYKIKPFDLLNVRNLQNLEGPVSKVIMDDGKNSNAFRVDENGNLNLPVIGEVKVIGLNRFEAQHTIQNLYKQKLFKDPIIEVTVANSKVTVFGEVSSPGYYSLDRDKINIIELIGNARGLTANADPAKIKIIRGDLKNPEIIYVNLKNINSLGSTKLILQNNDIVYITPKKVFNVSEGLRNYTGLIQPALLLINAFILVYTLK